MHIKQMMVGVAIWAVAAGLCSADWYVATNGTGQGTNGWPDATNSLLGAVAKAPNNSTVWLSNGTFSITSEIAVTTAIRIKGYYGPVATVLTSGWPVVTNRCFNLNNASAWLDGLTISNFGCGANYGGNVYITTGNITNCNIMYGHAVGGFGAGIYVATGPALIIDSKLCYSEGSSFGGAVSSYGAGVNIINCEVYNNSSGNGGAFFINGSGIVSNCIIRDNWAWNGGVASVSAAPNGQGLIYRNCLIYRNQSTNAAGVGGAFSWSGNTYSLINCTIVSNRAAGYGGAIRAYTDARPGGTNFVNCIIYSNSSGYGSAYDDLFLDAGTPNLFFNCCAQNVYGGPLPINQGNITNYPNFVDPNPGNPNYRLQANSPCIDAGTNQTWMDTSKDLDGRQRIDQWRRQADMGAYEFLRAGTMFLFP